MTFSSTCFLCSGYQNHRIAASSAKPRAGTSTEVLNRPSCTTGAVRVAAENIERNGQQVTVRQGDLLSAVEPGAVFELAIANIIADVIIALCGQIVSVLRSQGKVICSGIIREREADVVAALEGAGFEVVEIRRRGEWVAICAQRVD